MNYFLTQGRKLVAEGKLEQAVVLYRQGIAQMPNFAWYYHGLGTTLSKKGNLNEAITAYRKAVELNSSSAWFQYDLGQELEKCGELDNALICYQKAVEIDENFTDALCKLGKLKFQDDNSNKFQEKRENESENKDIFEVENFLKILKSESNKLSTRENNFAASKVIEENINITLPKIKLLLHVDVIKEVFRYAEQVSKFSEWHQSKSDFDRMMKTIFSCAAHQLKTDKNAEKLERAFLLFRFARNKAEHDLAIKEVASVIPIIPTIKNKDLISRYIDVVFYLWIADFITKQDFFALMELVSEFPMFNYLEDKNIIFINVNIITGIFGRYCQYLGTKLPTNLWKKEIKTVLCFWISANYPTHQLVDADRILFLIPYFLKNLLSKNNAKIILDSSREGAIPEHTEFFNMMSRVTQVLECTHNSFVCLSQNNCLPIYLKTHSKDYYSQPEINILPFNSHFWNFNSFSSQVKGNPNSVRQKKFLCLNNMPRIHRIAITMFFYSEGLLDDSYFSFNLMPEEQPNLNFIRDLISPVTTKNIDVDSLYKEVYSILPLRIDLDKTKEFNAQRGEFVFKINDELFSSSFFYIVTESNFDDGKRNRRFTEKTIKSIVSLNPFLVLGQPGTLKDLRNLGFQTFSDFVDESYDEVIDPVKRFQMVCQEILKLASLSYEEMESLYKQMYPILEYNQAMLSNVQRQLQERIFDSM